MTPLASPVGDATRTSRHRPTQWLPNAPTQQSSTKISNNSVVQALHLKEIHITPSALGAVFQ
ncbi:hypothetical protein H6G97_13975 [Nostoc flagelliforme FACHB-838]|uniref:Uncharacterized protein n=1 Tax=Nostoc flagelliforme FACHB-838 TaxID=2692904 RepID=A0ABR8DME8_9NOSO|nr:hypothetical protein [Nostoc flagelliforme]MBD2530619.1 hypothetical protein [Nostoc flagelliforme FACHB-838]